MNELETKEVEKEVKPVVETNKTNPKSNTITKKMYKLAIEASTGTVTDVARRLNITHGSVSLYLEKHPEIKELLADKRMSNVSLAEDVLFEHLNKDTDPKIRQDSAKYITSRLGKSKGWVESQQIEHSGNISSDSAEEMRKMWEECNANKEADINPSTKK